MLTEIPAFTRFPVAISTFRYTQREFLLLYGYSGCGKTTILSQFAEKYSNYIYLIRDFDALSPAQLLVEMGECINLPVKLRKSEMNNLKRQLKSLQGVMFLFDEVTAESASSLVIVQPPS